MTNDYARNVAGAIYNRLIPGKHGRGAFICKQFRISRSTLHRKTKQFKQDVCKRPGRPVGSEELAENRKESCSCVKLEYEIVTLKRTLQEEREQREQQLKKLTFMLVAVGLSGRVIAGILRLSFGARANHTDVLKKARIYAATATLLMQEHFHPCGDIAAIDEVYVDGTPVFVAVSPHSLLISNAAVYETCTEENWTKFLDEMSNLRGTVSDRGMAILAAICKRNGHTHQSDIFHCMHTVMRELMKLEKLCYSLIGKEEKARTKLEKRKISGRDARELAAKLRKAKRECLAEITRFDDLEQAVDMAFAALRISDGFTLNTAEKARRDLEFACEWIECVHPSWKKVVSAFRDPHLLHYIETVRGEVEKIHVGTATRLEREYVLAVLTHLWEAQASRRWRGKKVQIPEAIENDLKRCCPNQDRVCQELFAILEHNPKASSAVESINSRIGFFRYSKRRFSDDFVNLISVVHNLMPFMEGKRAGKSPAEIEGVDLPTMDIFSLFKVV